MTRAITLYQFIKSHLFIRSFASIFTVCLVLLFQSCGQEEIRLEELPPYTQKLVVNGIINQAGASLFLSNSASAFGLDSVNVIRDANVSISANLPGSPFELTYDPGIQRFVLNESFPAGTNYTLNAVHRGLNAIASTGKIPDEIDFKADYIPDGGIDTSGLEYDKIIVNLTDSRGVKNFYRINFYYHDDLFNQFLPMFFNLNHPGLNSRNSMVLRDGSVLFNDELIDGRNVEFNVVPLFGTGFGNNKYKYMVELESISEDLYRYYISINRAREAGNGGFDFGSNPVIVHTNIVNGLGIFGATNSGKDTLLVK
jgi:hypothetical protein